jgi:HEAT repeat protein
MGAAAEQAVPALVEAAKHKEAEVRSESLMALGEIAPEAQATREALEKGAQDQDPRVVEAVQRTRELIKQKRENAPTPQSR